MQIILNPDQQKKKTWGTLAHVSDEDRRRILNLGFGGFKPQIKFIKKQLKELRKKEEKKL